MTYAEFAAAIRKKNGGAYKDIPDEALVDKYIEKHPDYAKHLDPKDGRADTIADSPSGIDEPPSAGGFVANAVDSGINAVGDMVRGAGHVLTTNPAKTLLDLPRGVVGRLKMYAADMDPKDAWRKLKEGDVTGAIGTALPVSMAYHDPAGVAADVAGGVSVIKGLKSAASLPRQLEARGVRRAADYPTRGVGKWTPETTDPEAWRKQIIPPKNLVVDNPGSRSVSTMTARMGGKAPTVQDALHDALTEALNKDKPTAAGTTKPDVTTTATGKPSVGESWYDQRDREPMNGGTGATVESPGKFYTKDGSGPFSADEFKQIEAEGNWIQSGIDKSSSNQPLAQSQAPEVFRDASSPEWHSGADPGSPEARSAQSLHQYEGEMDAGYRRRLMDDKGIVTPDLLLGWLARSLAREGVKRGASHLPGRSAIAPLLRGAGDLGAIGRFTVPPGE